MVAEVGKKKVAIYFGDFGKFIAEGLESQNACRILKLRSTRGRSCIASYTTQEGLRGSAGCGHVGFQQGSCFILKGSGLKNAKVKGYH